MDFSTFLPPYQPVELPSRGKLYANPSLKDGWIHIREYAAPEEALLAQINRENVQQVLNSLLDSCIKGNEIKAEELTSEDAFYLLVWLRVNSYATPSYDVDVTCSHRDCGMGPDVYSVNLSTLKIDYLNQEIKEPLVITLPKTKLVVEINCMRRGIELRAQKRQGDVRKWKRYKGDPAELLKRAYSIVKVSSPNRSEETSDILEIENLCLNILPSVDSLYLDTQLERFKHGVDINTTVTCHYCQRDIPVVIPPGPEFFRPTRFVETVGGQPTIGDSNTQQVRETGCDVSHDAHTETAGDHDTEIKRASGERN